MMMTGKTDDELRLSLLLLYRRVKGKQIKASSDVKRDVFLMTSASLMFRFF